MILGLVSPKESPVETRLPWAGVLFLWVIFFTRAQLWWAEGSYYTYGWTVPPLAALLWWRRAQNCKGEKEDAATGRHWVLFVLLGIYLPLRLIAEPDPFWRLPLWAEAFSLSALTLGLAERRYGRGTWRTFTWPMVFLLTALPWPATMETQLVQGMSSQVTSFTAEMLLWSGYPAEATGHRILVDEKIIEIDASCSGIRSFQCLLAFGLFFGEYHLQSAGRRIFTLLAALSLAFGFNLVRAFSLSMISLEGTEESYETWHDPIGFMAVGCAFACLWAWSRNWKKDAKANEIISKQIKKDEPNEQEIGYAHQNSCIFRGKLAAWTFSLSCLLPEAFAASWFRYMATQKEGPDWAIRWPEDNNVTIQKFPISEGVEDVLQFDYGERVTIHSSEFGRAEIHFFGYDGSDPAASVCSRDHSPAHCMRAAGVKLLGGQSELAYITPSGARLVFRHYVTGTPDAYGRHPMHVYWCPWTKDERSGRFADPGLSWSEKGLNFLTGKVSFERKVLLLLFFGNRDFPTAKQDLVKLLNRIVTEAPQ